MLSFTERRILNPNQVWIKISEEQNRSALEWVQSYQFSNLKSEETAYLNRLCFQVMQQWLTEILEDLDVTAQLRSSILEQEIPSVWDIVTGSSITIGDIRLVLVPTALTDPLEIEVPQEWVDLADWVADYYVALQLDEEEGWLKILGYVPYQTLKTQADLDPIDRTYCLDLQEVIQDLTTLWIAREISPNPSPAVAELPPLGSNTISRLLQELSLIKDFSPRLDIPFAQWAALIRHSEWREELWRRRSQPITVLTRWLEGEFEAGWISLSSLAGDLLTPWLPLPQFVANRRGREQEASARKFQIGDTSVILVISLEPYTPEEKNASNSSSEFRILIQVRLEHSTTTSHRLRLTLSQYQDDEGISQEEEVSSSEQWVQLPRFLGVQSEQFYITISVDECHEYIAMKI
jgi:hypothetical protein